MARESKWLRSLEPRSGRQDSPRTPSHTATELMASVIYSLLHFAPWKRLVLLIVRLVFPAVLNMFRHTLAFRFSTPVAGFITAWNILRTCVSPLSRAGISEKQFQKITWNTTPSRLSSSKIRFLRSWLRKHPTFILRVLNRGFYYKLKNSRILVESMSL